LGQDVELSLFSTRSQAVTQYPLLLEKEKSLHGRHGMCFKLLPRYSLVSVLQSAQLQTSLASLKNLIMHDRASETNKVDEARLDLFARKQRQYNAVPPSSAALVQHVKRSVLQAGHTWGQALSRIQNLSFGYHTGHLWHLLLHPVRNF
jgi:hypothetical protein